MKRLPGTLSGSSAHRWYPPNVATCRTSSSRSPRAKQTRSWTASAPPSPARATANSGCSLIGSFHIGIVCRDRDRLSGRDFHDREDFYVLFHTKVFAIMKHPSTLHDREDFNTRWSSKSFGIMKTPPGAAGRG